MVCRITDMHNKEVINICDGMRLGRVDDVEVDTCTAQKSGDRPASAVPIARPAAAAAPAAVINNKNRSV